MTTVPILSSKRSKAVVFALGGAVIGAGAAHANRLYVAPDAPLWQHLGADTLLWLHIGGGVIGLLTGVAAIASRKGRSTHRLVGTVFLVSMFVTYAIGAGVAPFLDTGQRPNFVGGIAALYLLISGWMTVRSRVSVQAGLAHYAGLLAALSIAGMGFLFMQMGANSPTGTIDGSPPQAFILFSVVGSIAALGELNVILRGAISGPARIARHLWRMCISMFFASGSLFLGQPQVFPDWFNETPWPGLLAAAPLFAMLIWLFIVRVRPLIFRRRKAQQA